MRPNNLQATCPTDTHIETKHTHYAVHHHRDRDRLTDAWWDRREDTQLQNGGSADRKWAGGKKTSQCSTDQIRGMWVSLFGRVESGGVASPNLIVLHGWVGSRVRCGEVGGWVSGAGEVLLVLGEERTLLDYAYS